jgi:hypothetical protein
VFVIPACVGIMDPQIKKRKIISLVKFSFHIANAMERQGRSKERFVFVIRILILDIV